MMKIANSIGIVILIFAIVALCVWRAVSNHLTYWSPIDYIGIMGFGLTLITAWYAFFIKRDVQELSNRYGLLLRLPKELPKLQKLSKELKKYANAIKDKSPTIKEIAKQCCEICSDIEKIVKGQKNTLSQQLKEVIRMCKAIQTPERTITNGDFECLDADLKSLIRSIKKEMEESKVQ